LSRGRATDSVCQNAAVADDVVGYRSPYDHQDFYWIEGLTAKAEALSAARAHVDELIESRREVANAVLETASGPWAGDFRTKERGVLSAMANAWRVLGDCAGRCRTVNDWQRYSPGSYHPGSIASIEAAFATRTDLVVPPENDVEVDLDVLTSYITVAQGQHENDLAHLFDEVGFGGIRGRKGRLVQLDVPSEVVDGTLEDFTEYDLAEELPFLSRNGVDLVTLSHDEGPVDAITLSNDVLTYASDKRTELMNAGNGDGVGGNGGPGGLSGDMGIPTLSTPSEPPSPPPAELPEIPAEEALGVIVGSFSLIDRPDTDDPATLGRLTRQELALAAENDQLPPRVQAAALRVAEDPGLFAAVAVVHQPLVADPDLRLEYVTVDDITIFVDSVEALAVLQENVDAVDLPGAGGLADGIVSPDELQVAVNDPNLAPEVRDAARFLVDNPVITQRLAHYDVLLPSDGAPVDPESLLLQPIVDPATGEPVVDPETGHLQFEVAPFSIENLERMAADHGELLGTVEEPEPEPPSGTPGSTPRMASVRRLDPAVTV
jgi:hypothetical protein